MPAAGNLTRIERIREFSTGVKIIDILILPDDTTGACDTITLTGCEGRRVRGLVVKNGTTGLTAGSDVGLTDSISTVNITATNGADLGSNDVITYIAPDTTDPIVVGNLTLAVTGNSVSFGSTLTAGSNLTVGNWYEIVAQSDVDFTTQGSTSNDVGTRFKATDNETLGGDDSVKEIGWMEIYIVLF